jgi:hypothetical protein
MEKNGEIRLGVTPPEMSSIPGDHEKKSAECLADHITKRLADKVLETLTTNEDE